MNATSREEAEGKTIEHEQKFSQNDQALLRRLKLGIKIHPAWRELTLSII